MQTPPVSWRRLFYQSNYFPLALLLFLGGFYVIPDSKWHNNIYYTFLLLPFVIVYPWKTIRSRLSSPVMATASLLILYLMLSLLWSPVEDTGDYRKAISGLYVFIFLLLGTEVLLRQPDFFERLFHWLGWLIVITGPASIWWFYRNHPFPDARLITLGRLDHPGWTAVMYGFVGLYHFLGILQTRDSSWRRWLPSSLAALVALVVMLLGQSRGVLAALLITLLIGALLIRQWRYWLLLALLTMVFFLLVLWWDVDLLRIINRGSWDSFRLEIWRQAVALIWQSPVLGYGILEDHSYITSNGRTHPHPHNILLAACLYGGVFAGSLLLFLLVLVLYQGWLFWGRNQDIRPLLITIFGLVYMMTDDYKILSSPWPNWLYFWLPVVWAINHEHCLMTHKQHFH